MAELVFCFSITWGMCTHWQYARFPSIERCEHVLETRFKPSDDVVVAYCRLVEIQK